RVRAWSCARNDSNSKGIGSAGRKKEARDAALECETGAARNRVSSCGRQNRRRALYGGKSRAGQSSRSVTRRGEDGDRRKASRGRQVRHQPGVRLRAEEGVSQKHSRKTKAHGRPRLSGFAADQLRSRCFTTRSWHRDFSTR